MFGEDKIKFILFFILHSSPSSYMSILEKLILILIYHF
jgi:hypothetical protein